jgi:hypothetical protein
MEGRCGVSLVRLHSFACDDMHSKPIDYQSSFLFLKQEKEGIVKFMAVRDNRYEDIKSMILTFCFIPLSLHAYMRCIGPYPKRHA